MWLHIMQDVSDLHGCQPSIYDRAVDITDHFDFGDDQTQFLPRFTLEVYLHTCCSGHGI